jgi:hypothetical protein
MEALYVFDLCPSCSQKRTLLFGEHMNEQLLLLLPHRQMGSDRSMPISTAA